MPKPAFATVLLWFCCWACAGGDAAREDSEGAQPLEQHGAAPSTTAPLAEDANPQVLGGEENPTTEGSNTNWMPTDPWLVGARRPEDPRKPGTVPPAQTQSSASAASSPGASSGASASTPDPG
jgi:hypothetical protein